MALLLPVYMLLLGSVRRSGSVGSSSSLQVYLRDTAQVLTVVMTLWFWVTPIFISEELIPGVLRFLMRLNPLGLRRKSVSRATALLRIPDLTEFALLTAYAAQPSLSSAASFSDI